MDLGLHRGKGGLEVPDHVPQVLTVGHIGAGLPEALAQAALPVLLEAALLVPLGHVRNSGGGVACPLRGQAEKVLHI